MIHEYPHPRSGNQEPDKTDIAQGIAPILRLITKHIEANMSCYKPTTLFRRIQRRMALWHIEDLKKCEAFLKANPEQIEILYRDIMIGVTQFFREPDLWYYLENQLLPKLLMNFKPGEVCRVWVPGCSSGEEAITIAMILDHQIKHLNLKQEFIIFATDIDKNALSIGKSGLFSNGKMKHIPPAYRKSYFTEYPDQSQLNHSILRRIHFIEHNFIDNVPFSNIDLISCRNLFIYLKVHIQKHILKHFHFSLKPMGYLILGNSETIGQENSLYKVINQNFRIYQKQPQLCYYDFDFSVSNSLKKHKPSKEKIMSPSFHSQISKIAQQTLLKAYAPASVVVNNKQEILYFYGPTEKYLNLPSGAPQLNLYNIAKSGLRFKLKNTLNEAIAQKTSITEKDVRIKRDNNYTPMEFTVIPFHHPIEREMLFLVSFKDQKPLIQTEEPQADQKENNQAYTNQLELELSNVKEELQFNIEEMERKNEELLASNEEITAVNEELQSTNEEIEASKEEMKSLNEELNAVNQELQEKIIDLEKTNNDIINFINSTEIATIFLDKNFCIRRFTPSITTFFNLVQNDIGRPLQNFTQHFSDTELLSEAKEVMEKQTPLSKEIHTSQDRWYIRRILPFKTQANQVEGIILTFIDITNRKKTEIAFLESEGRFRRLTENATDMIYRMSLPEGKYEYVSPAAEDVFGYTPDDFYDHPILIEEAIHPDWKTYFEKEWHKLLSGNIQPYYEYQIITKSGEMRWIHQKNVLVRDDYGNPIAIEGIVSNITERKQSEVMLIESEKKYHSLYESMNEGMAIHEIIYNDDNQPVDYKIIDTNRAYERILDYKKETVLNIPASELYGTGEPPFLENYVRVALGGEPEYFEVHFPPMNKYFAISVFSPKENHFVTIFSDISERKRVSQELQDQKEFFEHAINSQNDTFFVSDPESHLPVIWNRAFEKASGYSREEIKTMNTTTTYLSKEEQEKISEFIKQIKEDTESKENTIQLNLIRKDKTAIPFEYSISPFRFSDQNKVYLISIGRNISERLKAQLQLEKSHLRFKKILENNTIPMIVTDSNWNITQLNQRFIQVFGYTMDDIQDTNDWFGQVYPDAAIKTLSIIRWKEESVKASLNSEQLPPYHIEIICKDKSLKIVQITSVTIGGENIVSLVDITDQMKNQENLEKALTEKEILLKEIHHRVKNNLQTVSSLLELQLYNVQDQFTIDILRESINRVGSMAEIHKQLYESDDIVNIDFKQFIQTISHQLLYSYQKSDDVTIDLELTKTNLDINIAVPCGLVLNEIMTNSLKHAFPEKTKGHIKISIQLKDNHYYLDILDNGVGMPPDLDIKYSNSMGLTLIHHIVQEQLNGDVDYINQGGTHIHICFPLNPYPNRHPEENTGERQC